MAHTNKHDYRAYIKGNEEEEIFMLEAVADGLKDLMEFYDKHGDEMHREHIKYPFNVIMKLFRTYHPKAWDAYCFKELE